MRIFKSFHHILAPKRFVLPSLLIIVAPILLLSFPFEFFHVGEKAIVVQKLKFSSKSEQAYQDIPDQDWVKLSLPDSWKNHKEAHYQGWYKSQIMLTSQSDAIWSIFIPHVAQNVRVFINGQWVGQGGRFAENSHYWNDPFFFSFSGSLLTTGSNTIAIKVRGIKVAGDNFLSQFYVAKQEDLLSAWRWYRWLRVESVAFINCILIGIFGFLTVLWIMRKREAVYGWFALASATFFIYNLNLVIPELPVPFFAWQSINFIAIGWSVLFCILSSYNFIGLSNKKIIKIIKTMMIYGCIPLFIPNDEWIFWYGINVWCLFILFITLFYLYLAFKAFVNNAGKPELSLIITLTISNITAINDFCIQLGFFNADRPFFLHIGYFLVFMNYGWFILRRFVSALVISQSTNEQLEQRVRDKEHQLETQYQKEKIIEHETLVLKERERIMQDMHDGVGGQLVSAVSLLETNSLNVFQVKQLLRDSLNDLRLIIDSLDSSIDDVGTLLGMFRYRMEPRLKSSGISLDWNVRDVTSDCEITPQKALHLLRILQETFTNTLKHSSADKIKFTAETLLNKERQQCIKITISDNGRGAEIGGHGRGIYNMKKRANELGGKISFLTSLEGITVILTIPCHIL